MEQILTYKEFAQMDSSEKADFLDMLVEVQIYKRYSIAKIKLLLNTIIIEENNNYLRRQALANFAELTLIRYFQPDALIAILLDDLDESDEVFIQVLRLKFLFTFYNGNTAIIQKIEQLTKHTDAEVAGEAYFRKGLLSFLKITTESETEYIGKLQECIIAFGFASNIGENRIDAQYYLSISDLLMAIPLGNASMIHQLLGSALSHLWNLKLFSSNTSTFSIEANIAIVTSSQ
ncbi:hypothetical protein QFZ48_002883 [Chitinophaga sp. W2I13]|uniref:hypothetical protein n=1 Tax=Chitinophaga sp. W2I13 TaxID=3373923 RepID=UPI003D23F5D2